MDGTLGEFCFLMLNVDTITPGATAGKAPRPPRPGPCLDFGFQYALIRNNWSKKVG